MFSYLVRPLFETYKKAMEGMTTELFVDSVGKWVEDNMSLISLRPAILTALRKVSTKTGIMERPQDFRKDVQQIILHLGDVNQNDSTRRDAEIVIQNSSVEQKQAGGSGKQSPLHLTQVPGSQTVHSSQKSNENLDSIMKVSSPCNITSQVSHANYQSSILYGSHAHHNTILPDNVMDLHITQPHSVAKHSQVHNDVPMTSAELWDIPATLPAVDSNSSLSDLVFTHAEESTLYDSILNTLETSETTHEQMQVQPILHDLTQNLFSANNTTTTSSSALPLMATGQDQNMDMLQIPSFSDMEMSQALDPALDNVTFLLDLDPKDSSMFHSNNSASFSDL